MSAAVSLGEFANNMSRGMLPAGVDKVPQALLKSIAGVVLNDIQARFRMQNAPDGTPWPKLKYRRIRGGNIVLSDTGVLRASIHVETTATGVMAYSNLPYARIHNYGGRIVPVRAKFLAIPMTREAMRYKSPRRFPRPLKTIIGKAKTGGIMFETIGGVKVIHYALTKEVNIPKREFMGISAQAMDDIAIIAGDYGFRLAESMVTQKA